jgi:cytochrome c peroxidase
MSRAPVVLLLALAVAGCQNDQIITEPPSPTLDAQLRSLIGGWGVIPIGEMPPQNPALVELGRALFFDKILSGNKDIACATCHDPGTALADARSLAVGTGGHGLGAERSLGPGRKFTPRGAPTLLNAGLGLSYLFWDARLSGGGGQFVIDGGPSLPPGLPTILVAQAMLPVLNRQEMRGESGDLDRFGQPNELARLADDRTGEIWDAIMERVLAISQYVQLFNAGFPGGGRPRFEHAARALAAFEMESFTKTRSPFDRYLDRNDQALSTEAKRGGVLFFGKARCSSCHNGPFLGAQRFANVGAPQVGPGGSRQPPLDLGRGEHDDNEFYRFAFRVPPLRNVELTAPYFHSGAYPTLEAVVHHYNDIPTALRSYDPSQLDPAVRASYHGDQATIEAVLATLDPQLREPLRLTEAELADLVSFLKSLTDPAARTLGGLAPAAVPSGLPVRD